MTGVEGVERSSIAMDKFAASALLAVAAIGASAAVGEGACASGGGGGFEFDARIKWFSTAQWLPESDAQRDATGNATPVDHSLDLRLLWRRDIGPLKAVIDHSAIWFVGDSFDASDDSGPIFDQTPTGDERRLLDLTWEVDDGGRHRLLHRLDRFALEYRSSRWGVAVGRQAVSWGGGLVFHPMDLFNPFAPTTADQDYKAGDDLILVERLFGDGSDLQFLAVGRRTEAGDADPDASSVAVKFKGYFRDSEFELMAARHYDGAALGVGLRVPVAGALVRSDLVGIEDDAGWTISGVLNVDVSFPAAGTSVHAFAEYFHNGFGVDRLPDDLDALPSSLTERLRRGESFNLMRDYLAAGVQFQWHVLVSQSVSLIANVHDGSMVAQASLGYDPSDASRLQFGLIAPLGGDGDEFGPLSIGENLTVGGGTRGYLRFVYFF